MDTITIPIGKQATFSVAYQDAGGNAAKVDGSPAWTSSDSANLTVEPAADGMSAIVRPSGAIGTYQVTVGADADLGEGVKSLVTLGDIEVVAGEAVAGTLTAGPLEDVPPTA